MHLSRWRRFVLLVSVVQLSLLLIDLAHAEERRIALVVGNGNYAHVPHLSNPAGDARAIAAALQRLGFDTRVSIDADRATMERSIREFGDRARVADVALFYYAGHAFQVSDRNLLIPVNANIREERDLRFETLDLDDVLGQVSGRSNVNIIFVDACRDNPFSAKLRSGTRGIKVTAGPAPVSASAGTFIAFATAPGTVADDGAGKNSPFTTAILDHIEKPGLEIRQMMGRVRQSVRQATNGRQIPWENSSLEGDFYFRPPEPQLATLDHAGGSAGQEAEIVFWDSVKNSPNAKEYQAYLDRFPQGVFVPLARARLEQIAGALPAADPANGIPQAKETVSASLQRGIAHPGLAAHAAGAGTIDSRSIVGVWQGSGTDGAQVLVAYYPTQTFEQRQLYSNGFVLTVTGRWSVRGRLVVLEPTQANPSVICNAPNDCRPVPLDIQEVPIDLRDGGSVLATPYAVMARAVQ